MAMNKKTTVFREKAETVAHIPRMPARGHELPMPAAQKKDAGFDLKWLLLIVIGIFIVAGAWMYTRPGPATTSAGPGNMNTSAPDPLASPGAIALLSSFDRLSALPDSYNLAMSEPISGIDSNLSLQQKGGVRIAVLTTMLDSREYYWSGSQVMACEQPVGNKQMCGVVGNETLLVNYGTQLNGTFPAPASAASQKINQAGMIQMGAVKFGGAPEKRTVAGRSCTYINYSYDFSRLTAAQLGSLGMSASDPVVSVFRNFRVEKCFDDQLGLSLLSHLQYDYADPKTGQVTTLENKLAYQSLQAPLAGSLTAPTINANSSDVLGLMASVNQMLSTIGTCQSAPNQTAHDQCVRTNAVNFDRVDLCQLANDTMMRDQCVLIIASSDNIPADCAQAGNMTNDCYTTIAADNLDANGCSLISNAQARQSCLDTVAAAKKQSANAPKPATGNGNQTASGNRTANATDRAPTSAGQTANATSQRAVDGGTGNAVVPPTSNGSGNGLSVPGVGNATAQRAAG